MTFQFKNTKINDVILITRHIHKDSRGYFCEAYKQSSFLNKSKIDINFVQDNLSCSNKGVIRGLHFQKPPFAQAKLVQCIKGAILDVAVDLRYSSPTYGQWISEILSEENGNMLFIPEGFAHGFLSLENNSIIYYKCSNEYSKQHEGGVIYNDPNLNINWLTNNHTIIEKDLSYPTLKNLPIIFN